MNLVLSITGSMITDRHLVTGCMNIQTADSIDQIDFSVDVLEFVNLYVYDLTETLNTLRPDFVKVIDAYATMFWVNCFFSDEAESYEIEYQNQLKNLMNKLVKL